jgi:import inner membrane translocase subunit TIM44
MKALDPTFNKENFERELREYIVPDVVDTYLSADQEALKEWCGEAVSIALQFCIGGYLKKGYIGQTYNGLWATMEQYRQGLISDSKVLDICQVKVSLVPRLCMNATDTTQKVSDRKILDNNIPVFVITFATQEMLLFRNAKTREIVVGAEDKVEQCQYAAVITRVKEDLANELTGVWKVIEVCSLDLVHCKSSTLTACNFFSASDGS